VPGEARAVDEAGSVVIVRFGDRLITSVAPDMLLRELRIKQRS
jgi:hypothetical protein